MIGVSLAGFITTVLPVISAPTLIPTKIAAGKLNGAITAHTPYGFIILVFCSFLLLPFLVTNPLFFCISSE